MNGTMYRPDRTTAQRSAFFEEPAQFDYLLATVIPSLEAKYHAGRSRPLRIWSAGCSSGEEPYSLAMLVNEYAQKAGGFNYSVIGSDVSPRSLEQAGRAVYAKERTELIPQGLQKRYLLFSPEVEHDLTCIAPEIRQNVLFRHIKLMDERYPVREPIDVIFCRNVLSHFDLETRQRVVKKLCRHLFPGRYLFTGRAETLSDPDLPLRQVAPGIYRRTG